MITFKVRESAWISLRFLIVMLVCDAAQCAIFDKCALAKRLLHRHHLAWEQVQTWVCIARFQSNFNTAIVNYDAQGIGYHGMYQISDRYWCGPGNACNLNCERLLNDDLSDDLACISHIFAEHQRISGNGYTAWTVYERNCALGRQPSIDECFEDGVISLNALNAVQPKVIVHDKVYDRCELARELRFVHGLPSDQISTWVCIAKHESNFHTSVVGRLNADGSGDHGLFQISDIYWCSPNGWACDVTCDQLRDSNITDDVLCIKTIFAEHQRLSGDGFNAWAVYQPYCRHRSAQYIEGCFEQGELEKSTKQSGVKLIVPKEAVNKGQGKVYTRCELAEELRYKHNLPENQIPTWVCIAYHESRYNTSAVGRLNADGSGDHGIFQISDIYWCSPPGKGWVCGLSCSDLEDNDITDDVKCMQTIYEEHQRLSGDGFNAWAVYQSYCRGNTQMYVDGCFESGGNAIGYTVKKAEPISKHDTSYSTEHLDKHRGKVYGRCELARELRFQHSIPLEQIATWVCIAKHESLYNTAAVGRLNADGSADHGLFQISDIYWCSMSGKAKVCGLSCSELEDSDITDDVQCIRKIHNEHTRLSGDGFRAWAVYEPYCRGKSAQYTDGCFDDEPTVLWKNEISGSVVPNTKAEDFIPKPNGKVYERCELALELHDKHHIPLEQVSTWVCIADHESHFNTSAVGRLNGDGSADHGIFQISDIYWCSPPGQGWACGVSCSQLEDNDITDDIKCLRTIYEEHQRLSGDGFNAWAVYPIHCKGKSSRYTEDCFTNVKKESMLTKPETKTTTKSYFSTAYWSRPTLSSARTTIQQMTEKSPPTSKTTPYTRKPATEIGTKPSANKSSSSTANTFALYLNGYSTIKPSTFYPFTATRSIPTTTWTAPPAKWNGYTMPPDIGKSTQKWSQQSQTSTLKPSIAISKWHAAATQPKISLEYGVSSTQKPPTQKTTTTTTRYLSKQTSLSIPSSSQRPWPTKSSSSAASVTPNLHSIAAANQSSIRHNPSSTTKTPATYLSSSWTWKPSSLKPSTKPPSTQHHLQNPATTKSTTTTTKTTSHFKKQPTTTLIDATAQTIFDIQATTKSAFDKLFDMFKH